MPDTNMPNAKQPDELEMTAALASLERLFSAFGADPARWPPAGRELLAAHAHDPRVVALAGDARALDRLLATSNPAIAGDPRIATLTERICSAAEATAPRAMAPDNVIAFQAPARQAPARQASARQASARMVSMAARRAGVAALAASLMLGVFVGTSGAGANALRYASVAFGMADEEPELASSADMGSSLDEVL